MDMEVIGMGIIYIEGVVTGPTGKQATVRFLIDRRYSVWC